MWKLSLPLSYVFLRIYIIIIKILFYCVKDVIFFIIYTNSFILRLINDKQNIRYISMNRSLRIVW